MNALEKYQTKQYLTDRLVKQASVLSDFAGKAVERARTVVTPAAAKAKDAVEGAVAKGKTLTREDVISALKRHGPAAAGGAAVGAVAGAAMSRRK